ncbi:hypothetical protein QTP86_007863 [Hemibagrus guttatus]|nr:hypothetical protein QTP86_007863 [Hemibagrus guttatus]
MMDNTQGPQSHPHCRVLCFDKSDPAMFTSSQSITMPKEMRVLDSAETVTLELSSRPRYTRGSSSSQYAERRKLDKKAVKLHFVGYANHAKDYRLFDEEKRRILIHQDVVFNESVSGVAGQFPARPGEGAGRGQQWQLGRPGMRTHNLLIRNPTPSPLSYHIPTYMT